jgi:hypothetical protein
MPIHNLTMWIKGSVKMVKAKKENLASDNEAPAPKEAGEEEYIKHVVWAETPSVEGTIRYRVKRQSDNGEYEVMGVDTPKGIFEFTLSTVLKNSLEELKAERGDKIAVVYLGMRLSENNRKYRDFSVAVLKQSDITEFVGAKG